MPFQVQEANVEDASSIAAVLLSAETEPLMRLQLGSADSDVLNKNFKGKLKRSIAEGPRQKWIVARDEEGGRIISYAQWELPRSADDEDLIPNSEEQERQKEQYRKDLPPGMNESLVLEFREKIKILRARILTGKRYYLLGNLGTLPEFRGRGAASALVSWSLASADQDGMLVYLDTDGAGPARRLYEKLGFRRVGEMAMDLSRHGGEGVHTHIAMCREPQQSSS